MKQTAVEWLVEQLENHNGVTRPAFDNVIQQAKAMEKEQIIDAYLKDRRGEFDKMLRLIYDADQYYNETFKSE